MKYRVKLYNSPQKTIKLASGGSKTMMFAATTLHRLSQPYVPASQSNVLYRNVLLTSDDKKGYIYYRSPYARFQWYGVVMIGQESHSPYAKRGEKKITTSKALVYKKPTATKQWTEAAKKERGSDLIAAVQKYIKRG